MHALRRVHVLSRIVDWRSGVILARAGSPFKHRLHFLSTATMSSQDLAASLASLSITPATVSHPDTNSPASWRDALLATSSAPQSFELIKTLVYKPKTAKTATTIPVVVIARDDTETSSSALAKKLNLKELRLASEDLLSEFFGLDKNSRASTDLWALTSPDPIDRSLSLGVEQGYLFQGGHRDRRLHRVVFCHVRCPRALL